MEWTKEKPDFPCVFITRKNIQGEWKYRLWSLVMQDAGEKFGNYLALYDNDGDECGNLEELEYFEADGYLVLEKL